MPAEVFLSHTDADRQFVEPLAQMLQRHGVPVGMRSIGERAARSTSSSHQALWAYEPPWRRGELDNVANPPPR